VFDDAEVDNSMEEDDKLVESAKATLAEQLEIFKAEATKQSDAISTSYYGIAAVHPGMAP
jgi:hypothetical protein